MRHPLNRSFSSLSLVSILSAVDPLGATNYAITTVNDDVTTNGNCTLREALQAATTNAAVDACSAGSATGADSIALAAGIYLLPIGALVATVNDELQLRGPAADPPTAVISGGATHRILDLPPGSGRLTLEDLELRQGNGITGADPLGGAVRAGNVSLVARHVLYSANRARRGGALAWYATGSTKSLVVEACRFYANEALHPDAFDEARGGALWLNPTGPASIRIADSDFVGNRVYSTLAGDIVVGGAILLATEGTGAAVRFERLRLLDNIAESTGASGAALGGGLSASLNAAPFVMEDVLFDGNDEGLTAGGDGAAMVLGFTGGVVSTLDRLRISNNGVEAGARQASIAVSGSSSVVVLRDTLVTGGGEDGLGANAFANGILFVDHLTIADNSRHGLYIATEGGSAFVANSIFYGNGGVDLFIEEGTPAIGPECLIGVDPLFVDAAAGNYALEESSPAVDTGDTVAPHMGPYDLAHAARIVGPETDLGAYERGGIFTDGFESGSAGTWSW